MASKLVGFGTLCCLCACGHAASPAPSANSGGASGSGAGDTTSLTLEVAGVTRRVLVHTPPSPAHPAALVLNLHGSGANADGEQAYTAMDGLADAHGFLVAYPEAAIALGAGFAWNVPGQPLLGGGAVPAGAADDERFIAELIAFLEQRYDVDARRVYAAGMSGGARMTSDLGCALAGTLAAIAPVAGLRFPAPCATSLPVPVVAVHGTADTTNPYQGNGQGYWVESVPSALAAWAEHDACGAERTEAVTADVALTDYPGCAAGTAVELYTLAGAGHEWPGAPGQSQALDANRVIWEFFEAHPRP